MSLEDLDPNNMRDGEVIKYANLRRGKDPWHDKLLEILEKYRDIVEEVKNIDIDEERW